MHYKHMYQNFHDRVDGKIILRPLSDMTKDEFLIVAQLLTRLGLRQIDNGLELLAYNEETDHLVAEFSVGEYGYRVVIDSNFDIRVYSYIEAEDGYSTGDLLQHNHNQALVFAYLIDCGFDVFEYIRTGEAVSSESLEILTT